MSKKTGISWTDATWNPVRGCSRVSKGCENCYAEKIAHRFKGKGQPYEGLTRDGRWNGKIKLVPEVLDQPIRWRKPRRIFVNSMSDLFHEGVPFEYIAKVFGVMAYAREHTFQILTKRPERAREFMRWIASPDANPVNGEDVCIAQRCLMAAGSVSFETAILGAVIPRAGAPIERMWPLPNVWLGVSAENQETADERIPILLDTPAAIRFVSAEPLLGSIALGQWLRAQTTHHLRADVVGMLRNRSFDALQDDEGRPMHPRLAQHDLRVLRERGVKYIPVSGACADFDPQKGCPGHRVEGLDWIIVGGESGTRSRACDADWIRAIVGQCRDAGVSCFVKQLGTNAKNGGRQYFTTARKGTDPAEWPEDLRGQEHPA